MGTNMTLQVADIFDSVQGEGYWTGLPVTFLRLQGCNLRCAWCDTKETWGEGGDTYEVPRLAEALSEHTPPVIIVTGGEPLMQPLGLTTLMTLLDHKTFMLETNGTLRPPHRAFRWVTVSPKGPAWRVHPEFGNPDEIKVVVHSPEEIAVAARLSFQYPRSTMSLQPVDNDPEIVELCLAFLAGANTSDWCVRWRLSAQTHKLLHLK